MRCVSVLWMRGGWRRRGGDVHLRSLFGVYAAGEVPRLLLGSSHRLGGTPGPLVLRERAGGSGGAGRTERAYETGGWGRQVRPRRAAASGGEQSQLQVGFYSSRVWATSHSHSSNVHVRGSVVPLQITQKCLEISCDLVFPLLRGRRCFSNENFF